MEGVPGFFDLDATHRAAAKLILSSIKAMPARPAKPGEKQAKAVVNRWVYGLYQTCGEEERIVQVVAENNPLWVKQIKHGCNIEEIATAYAYRMSETEGMGFGFRD